MKNRISTFLAGMFTMLLLGTLTISALAISGNMTIEVSPINIQIDGEIFQPKDAGGNDVPVFVYNGTTYAPLRALAEAYGLEVGYDAEKNMASVTNPNKTPNPVAQSESPVDYSDWTAEEEAAYQEFKGMWEVDTEGSDKTHSGTLFVQYLKYIGQKSSNELTDEIIDNSKYMEYYKRMCYELKNPQYDTICIVFGYGYENPNFDMFGRAVLNSDDSFYIVGWEN